MQRRNIITKNSENASDQVSRQSNVPVNKKNSIVSKASVKKNGVYKRGQLRDLLVS